MRSWPAIRLFCAVLLAAAVQPGQATTEAKQSSDQGWISLFNGQDLTGWSGDPEVWGVKDGYIIGKAEQVSRNTFLIHERSFSDFILEIKCMLVKGEGFTNSGIQYRSMVVDPDRWIVGGYQADMGRGWWGALYEEKFRSKPLFRPAAEVEQSVREGEWNQYVITADGITVKQLLNGIACGEFSDTDEEHRRLEGVIALQYHAPGKNFEARFKDIRIKLIEHRGGTCGSENYPDFKSVELASDINVGYGITAADVNGDGKLDVVVVDTKQIWWFENPGWDQHALTEPGQTKPHNVAIAAGDLDGDGKVDFAVGADWRFDTATGGDVIWLTRHGDPYRPWTVVPVAHEPMTHRLAIGDIDGDGRPELINLPLMGRGSTREKNWMDAPLRVLAYKIPADPSGEPWTEITLDHSLHVAHNLDVVTWSGGPAQDVLVASYDGVHVLTRQPDGTWSKTHLGAGDQRGAPNALTRKSLGAGEVRLGRLPGGGRYLATVEPWHGHQVVIYVERSGDRSGPWSRQVIDDTGRWGHWICCADIRGVGYDDLIVGWRDAASGGEKPGVVAYVPQDAVGKKWCKHVLDESVAVESMTTADFNGDGKLDIAVAGRQTHNVKLLFQR